MRWFTSVAAFGAVIMMTVVSPVAAQDCAATKPVEELEAEDVQALYDCIKDALVEGYRSGDNQVAQEYRDWKAASVRPASPGVHGERFLMTWVNEVGYDQYVEFAEEGVEMPEGTVIAKESFKLNDAGAIQPGPLFIMTKAAAGGAPDADDWVYSAVQPNGKPMGIAQSFCHDCHGAFEGQDALGYPIEDVRVSR